MTIDIYMGTSLIVGLILFTLMIIILIGELFFWAKYWIHRKDKPRDFFWSIIGSSFGEYLERSISTECYYTLVSLGGTFGALVIGSTWIVSVPILTVFIIIIILRLYFEKKEG